MRLKVGLLLWGPKEQTKEGQTVPELNTTLRSTMTVINDNGAFR